MSSDEASLSKPDKLNGDNYHSWKFNIKLFLMGKDLYDIVDGTEVLGDNATPKEREQFRKRDNKALSIIGLSVATDLQIYVRPAKSSAEAWKSLSERFEEKTLAKICYYRKILYRMQLGKGQTMEAYVNHMKTIAEHLENLDDPVAEKDLVYILISSLPPDYHNLITALETLKKEELTWTYVRDRVISEHLRKKSCDSSSSKSGQQDALYTFDGNGNGGNRKSNNKFKGKGSNNQFNRKEQQDEGKGTGNSNNNKKFTLKCHHCDEKGHLRRDCPKYLANSKNSGSASFSLAQATCSPEFALKIADETSVGDDWYVDSGASQHMDPDKEDFENYKEFETPLKVNLADDSYLLALGSGDVCVRLYDSNCSRPWQFDVLLKNTLYSCMCLRLETSCFQFLLPLKMGVV